MLLVVDGVVAGVGGGMTPVGDTYRWSGLLADELVADGPVIFELIVPKA